MDIRRIRVPLAEAIDIHLDSSAPLYRPGDSHPLFSLISTSCLAGGKNKLVVLLLMTFASLRDQLAILLMLHVDTMLDCFPIFRGIPFSAKTAPVPIVGTGYNRR